MSAATPAWPSQPFEDHFLDECADNFTAANRAPLIKRRPHS
jgi:hypothetical protein